MMGRGVKTGGKGDWLHAPHSSGSQEATLRGAGPLFHRPQRTALRTGTGIAGAVSFPGAGGERRGASPRFRRGALLLEVVVALTIVVATMGVLGSQLVSGLRLTADADQLTRAAALVDRLLALVEMDPEMRELILLEEQTDGDFGEQYPGWFWEVEFQPVEQVEGLGLVRVAVLYQEDLERVDSSDGARVVRQVVLLKAAPGQIDLVEDFGMGEEQVEELAALLPMAEFDPAAVDPQMLVAALTENPEVLLEMLPALLPLLQQYMANSGGGGGAGGGSPFGPGGLAGQFGGEFAGREFAEEGEKDLPGGGAPAVDDLVRLRDEMIGGAPERRGGGRGGAGGARGGREGRGGAGRGGRGGASGRPERGGGRAEGGGDEGGQPRYTIEDLMRLRDEMMRQQGGG